MRRFVVVSGLPASGKSTLARQLAPLLGLPVIDKDVILERLFAARGAGDAVWRRTLSRESDVILVSEAKASAGAILVSFWRLPGMAPDTGTPAEWLFQLGAPIVHVRCVCPPEVAAERFLRRQRHPGHLDVERSPEDTLSSLRAMACLAPIEIGPRIDVDTTEGVGLDRLARDVSLAFGMRRYNGGR